MMKCTACTALLALLMLFSATSVQAAPHDALQGEWVGTMPDVGATIHLNFVDEDTLIMTMVHGVQEETMEMRYEATEDEITIFDDTTGESETAAWEITQEGTLMVMPEGHDQSDMEFHRPSDE